MGALRHAIWVAVSVALATGGCLPKKTKGGPDAAASASGSGRASAAPAGSGSGAGAGPASVPVPPPVPAKPVDPLAPKDRALVERTKANVREVDALVKKDTVAENGVDATQKCAAIEEARERIETLPDGDGDLAALVVETKRLCSFEVPVLSANAALKQAGYGSSQASHKLVCDLAQKEFAKARSAKPNDRKIYDLGGRLAATCK